MHQKKIIVITFFCVLFVISLFESKAQHPYSYAPQFDYSQFPPVQHSVPLYRQNTLVWCWVASAKMIADYYQWKTPNQCQMLKIQYNSPCCANPALCARPGHIAEIQALIARFGGKYSSIVPPANGFVLYYALKRGPIVLHTRQGSGHFVVATGMKVVPSRIGPLGVVKINDPLIGRYELTFPELMNIWDIALLTY